MALVTCEPALADLVQLDVLDVSLDGVYSLNEDFRRDCIAAYEAAPESLAHVFQDHLLARALSRGFAALVDVEDLALLALEIAVGDEAETPDA